MWTYIKDRLDEPTTRAAIGAFITAIAVPVAAGADLHTILMVGLGAALPTIGAAITPEKKNV